MGKQNPYPNISQDEYDFLHSHMTKVRFSVFSIFSKPNPEVYSRLIDIRNKINGIVKD